jgi:hypothetical protein
MADFRLVALVKNMLDVEGRKPGGFPRVLETFYTSTSKP